jgi:non-heme chloroperoxidase
MVIPSSPLAGDNPVTIHYQEEGQGPTLVFLHGGWGYDMYPIESGALARRNHVLVPTRSGYGRSTPLEAWPSAFHSSALTETLAVLDQLGIGDAVWWGHSDGAVIAAMAAIEAPRRVRAVILEALHYYAAKPRSRAFFQRMVADPDSFGDRVCRTLAAEHGEAQWRTVLRLDGQAWLDLAERAPTRQADLYDRRLDQITKPILLVHGRQDPRTEPGELDAIVDALPHAVLAFYADAGHSPHSEASANDAVTTAVAGFIDALDINRD